MRNLFLGLRNEQPCLRQSPDLTQLPVARRVVVIGGGSTAIDIAMQSRRLGAEEVSIVYRRSEAEMSATAQDRILARSAGVRILCNGQPHAVSAAPEGGQRIRFAYTRLDNAGRLQGTGTTFELLADQIFVAIGQTLSVPLDGTDVSLRLDHGKIAVDANRLTSLPGVWAGGDCIQGKDLTVTAVADGKIAAAAIDHYLSAIPLGPLKERHDG